MTLGFGSLLLVLTTPGAASEVKDHAPVAQGRLAITEYLPSQRSTRLIFRVTKAVVWEYHRMTACDGNQPANANIVFLRLEFSVIAVKTGCG